MKARDSMENIFLILLFILFSSTSQAAVYYVDFVGGSDSNNGTSTSTPLKHCPGDGNYSPSGPAPTSLFAGDKVIFKGGVVYYTSTSPGIRLNWSGNGDEDENRIIYDGDSGTYAPRWGSGLDKAIIDGGGKTDYGIFSFYTSGDKNYITINGFTIRNGLSTFANHEYTGLIIPYGSRTNFVNITNNTLSNAGHYAAGTESTGRCIKVVGNHNKIHDNSLTDCYKISIELINGSYNEVYNNTITGISRWATSQGSVSNSVMTDNKWHDNIVINQSRNDESYEGIHQNHMYWWQGTGYSGAVNNTYIYNNMIYNSYSPVSEWGCGGIHQDIDGTGSWTGFYVFNNVIFNLTYRPSSCFSISTKYGNMRNVYILNNTCVVLENTGAFNYSWASGYGTITNVMIKNNIFYANNSYSSFVDVAGPAHFSGTVDINNNLYYSLSSPSFYAWTTPDTRVQRTWTQWKALGYDVNGIGMTTDPLFVSTTPGTVNLKLQAGSPAINAGANLTSLCSTISELCTSKDGVSRPQGAGWDIGAYQSVLGIPNPPSNLKIVQ